jgi:hypothetical protein
MLIRGCTCRNALLDDKCRRSHYCQVSMVVVGTRKWGVAFASPTHWN